jgi:hypothetical protein
MTSIEDQIKSSALELLVEFPEAKQLAKTKYIIQRDNETFMWNIYPQPSRNSKFKIANGDFTGLVHETIAQLKKHKTSLVSNQI